MGQTTSTPRQDSRGNDTAGRVGVARIGDGIVQPKRKDIMTTPPLKRGKEEAMKIANDMSGERVIMRVTIILKIINAQIICTIHQPTPSPHTKKKEKS